MVLVWFIYGLAFFALGFAVLIYPKTGSKFELARQIWLVGVFGILHGIAEWLDMFLDIGGPLPPGIVKYARVLILSSSFFFLVQFGVRVLPGGSGRRRLLHLLPLVLAAAWVIVLVVADPGSRLLAGDIGSRYLLCAPGAFLAALGFFAQIPRFRALKLHATSRSLAVASVVFLAYAVFAGLVVKKAALFPASHLNYETFAATIGIPVQIFRALCAVALAGSIIHILDIFRWETQEALRLSELRCTAIASAMPVFLFMIDRAMVVTFIKGKGLDALGFTADQALGQRIVDVFPTAHGLGEACRRAFAGKDFVATMSLGEVTLETYFSALRDEAGDIVSVAGVALDVSAKIRTQQELQAYRHRMEQQVRQVAVGALGATMAEEIAGPLSVARLRLEALAGDLTVSASSHTMRDGIRKSLLEVSKARDVLQGFMKAAQLQSETTEHSIGLGQIARRMTEVFAQSARRSRVSIATQDMDVVVVMAISSHEIEQVFYHLIQRALDAADPDASQELTIGCRTTGSHVELWFCDTCVGGKSGGLKHLFGRTLEDPRQIAGIGLGLAIVQQIVTGRGGEVVVESQSGRDTTFRVRLPVKRVC